MAKIAVSRQRTSKSETSTNQNEEITKLAYQFFIERGNEHGHDMEDWLRAEAIVKGRSRS